MTKEDLRKKFKQEEGKYPLGWNTQPAMPYIEWLENFILNSSQSSESRAISENEDEEEICCCKTKYRIWEIDDNCCEDCGCILH